MSPLLGVVFLILILIVAALGLRSNRFGDTSYGDSPCGYDDEMLAAPATDKLPVDDCTVTFYTKVRSDGRTQYCVLDGERSPICQSQPLPAIIAANEQSSPSRCSKVVWGFGCDKGLLCGLQQSGPNLLTYDTADTIARKRCGSQKRLIC